MGQNAWAERQAARIGRIHFPKQTVVFGILQAEAIHCVHCCLFEDRHEAKL